MNRWRWVADPAEVEISSGGSPRRFDVIVIEAISKGCGEWSPTTPELATFSRNRLQNLMEEKSVMHNGAQLAGKKDLREVTAGDVIEILVPEARPLTAIAQAIDLNLIYDDPHLLIVNKPQGLTVHPSETQPDGTLVNALLSYADRGLISGLSGIGGVLRPGIVHRLDKNTSGALVVSKTDLAHQSLTGTFAAHDIERTYLAFAYGAPKDDFISVRGTIGRSPTDRKKMAMDVKNGKPAHTDVRVLARYGSGNDRRKCFASLLALTLHTGRTHQIRVHLTSVQCSILGDPVYGVPTSHTAKWQALPEEIQNLVNALPGQALHAQVLGFKHPCDEVLMRFEAKPPREFAELRRILENYRIA